MAALGSTRHGRIRSGKLPFAPKDTQAPQGILQLPNFCPDRPRELATAGLSKRTTTTPQTYPQTPSVIKQCPQRCVRLLFSSKSYPHSDQDAFDTAPSSDCSEIVAPVPLRHHILQTSESRHWLGTPPLSPYSPPTSPLSTYAASPLRSKKRLSQTVSLNAIASHERARVTSITHPAALHPHKERKPEDEGSMAKRWLRWMHHEHMKAYVVPCLILASLWVKWAVGLGSYSGLQFIPFRQCYICLPGAQGERHHLCLATTRRNDTGWS